MEAYMRRVVLRKREMAPFTWAILGVLLILLSAATLLAAVPEGEDDAPAQGGMLMLHGKGVASEMPAVRLGTDVAVKVSGHIARVTVTQAFRNTSRQWMEATYLYPLPDDGAVDGLKMVVGDRIFVGRIKPREEAREIYEEALENGQKAGLVEEARANLFRNRVANVGPGETVLVQVEFQAPVRRVNGVYSLRLPLVVGPRYVPPHSLLDGTGGIDRAALADADDVTAPLAHPSLSRDLNPVSITVDLAPGFTPARIQSPYHRIDVTETADRTRRVTLAGGTVPADRDFELRWQAPGAAPALGLFRETHEGLDYVMAAITPPSSGPHGPVPPREMVFVIDNSGSMSGESMRAAKDSLVYALGTLRPEDRFNVIRFDDSMTELFGSPVLASTEQVATARRFAEGIDAQGGTEMLPALKAALVDRRGGSGLRQVIFLTDGSLSNEAEMMQEIARNRGRSTVFMVGVGSAPNTYLMRRMAEAGRGTFTHIGVAGEAAERMQELLDRLTTPVAKDLEVTVDGATLELAPRDLPDLYAGEPLMLLGRGKNLAGATIRVSGVVDGKPWSQALRLADAQDSDVVAKLWASRRIAEVEAQRWSGELDYELADAAIEELGMGFHLVTTRTSLVAVDETPSRPDGARLTREELPLLLPAGWEFDALFGDQLASGPQRDPDSEANQDAALELPQGATGFAGLIAQGLALIAFALATLVLLRRREGVAEAVA
jgi:Ca-activated chloride channel family protein